MFSITLGMKKEKSLIISYLGIILGIILIIIGIAGLFLPLIPGIILIIMGFVLFTGGSVGRFIKQLR